MSHESRSTLLSHGLSRLRFDQERTDNQEATPPVAADNNAQINILIVDDEPLNLTVLETVLDDPNYRLVRAGSGDEALLALVAEEFALLVLDIQMPSMNGFELAQMIKQRKSTANIPIIFLTAYYSDDQHMLEGYGTGAVDYLHKPINPTVLRSKVAVFAELHRKRTECERANRALLGKVSEHLRNQDNLSLMAAELEQRVAERTAELLASNEALRESEARLRSAVRNSRMLLYTTDFELRYTWISTPFPGFTFDQMIGRRDSDLLSPHEADALMNLKRQVLSSGIGDRGACVLEIGERRQYYDLTIEPLIDERGDSIGLTVAAIDITDLKQAEEALRQADRQKDEFLATLSHELRNPLAPIRTGLEVMKSVCDDPIALEQIRQTMERQAQQMVRLIDDLLDVSRITQGKLELRKCRVTLADVVQSAVEATRPFIEDAGHELIVTLPAELIHLDADPNRLAQVLSNLLNNATKYTPHGGTIWLSSAIRGSEIEIVVKDNGLGIPADMHDGIFELFAQIDSPLERRYKGLGIGLTLVRRLVEMHGGSIEVHSDGHDRGSEFAVRLPVVCPDPFSHLQEPSFAIEFQVQRQRVLVVDDNVDAATMLCMAVRSLGNDVRVAHDGLQAIHVAGEFVPNVVLMDLGMPRLNGFDAARQIRENTWGRDMVLVALTGWGQEEDKQRTREAGFDHHLVKPVDPIELLRLLAEYEAKRTDGLD